MNENRETQPKRPRGRPGGVMLTEEARIRMRPELLARVDQAAERMGMRRAAFVREVLRRFLDE